MCCQTHIPYSGGVCPAAVSVDISYLCVINYSTDHMLTLRHSINIPYMYSDSLPLINSPWCSMINSSRSLYSHHECSLIVVVSVSWLIVPSWPNPYRLGRLVRAHSIESSPLAVSISCKSFVAALVLIKVLFTHCPIASSDRPLIRATLSALLSGHCPFRCSPNQFVAIAVMYSLSPFAFAGVALLVHTTFNRQWRELPLQFALCHWLTFRWFCGLLVCTFVTDLCTN